MRREPRRHERVDESDDNDMTLHVLWWFVFVLFALFTFSEKFSLLVSEQVLRMRYIYQRRAEQSRAQMIDT
jgi:hypothetical protein